MSNMENGQNEDLLEGLASQTPVANTEDSAMDLEVSDSLGKQIAAMRSSSALRTSMLLRLVWLPQK